MEYVALFNNTATNITQSKLTNDLQSGLDTNNGTVFIGGLQLKGNASSALTVSGKHFCNYHGLSLKYLETIT